jgi:hypothetical protein
MTREELNALILDTRKRRRFEDFEKKKAVKKKSAAKKQKKKPAVKKEASIKDMLAGMTPEQKAELLKTLEG